MRPAAYIFAVVISILASCDPQSCLAEEPGPMRCSNSVCEWSMIKNKTLIAKQNGANLYKAEILRGYSFHRAGYIPEMEKMKEAYQFVRIKWNKGNPEKVIVFCYGRLPVYGTENKWFVLPFDSPYGAFHQAMSDFVHICYDAPRNAWQDGAFLEKHHLTMPLVNQVSVKDPKELFNYVK